MRCKNVRLIVAETLEVSARVEPAVQEHLDSCGECREFQRQMLGAWRALESYPSVEPSGDFVEKFYAKLSSPAHSPERIGRSWSPRVGWQWMALTACALVIGILFTVRPVPQPEYDEMQWTVSDRWDDEFLQDLERNMSEWESTYVPIYDSWPESLLEPSLQESLPSP